MDMCSADVLTRHVNVFLKLVVSATLQYLSLQRMVLCILQHACWRIDSLHAAVPFLDTAWFQACLEPRSPRMEKM